MSALLKQMRDRCEAIAKRVDRLSYRCGQASLHRLRVDIKKLRAVFRLLRAVEADFPYKQLHAPYRRLFAAAGAVRELQLQIQLLQTGSTPDTSFSRPYLRYLIRQYADARRAFRLVACNTHLPSWQGLVKHLKPATARCRPRRLDRYFTSVRARIDARLEAIAACDAEDLHDLRKAFKDYEANRKFAAQYFAFEPPLLAVNPAGVDNLIDQLGEWHDYLMANQRLEADLKESRWPPNVLAAGNEQLRRWQRKSRKLRRELVGQVRLGASGALRT